jgi:hypothetical protein
LKEAESIAKKFDLKIGLEGEKELKKTLTVINRSFKMLGSEMKLVASELDKNGKSVQALSARNSVLNKVIETQKRKAEGTEVFAKVPISFCLFPSFENTLFYRGNQKNQTTETL